MSKENVVILTYQGNTEHSLSQAQKLLITSNEFSNYDAVVVRGISTNESRFAEYLQLIESVFEQVTVEVMGIPECQEHYSKEEFEKFQYRAWRDVKNFIIGRNGHTVLLPYDVSFKRNALSKWIGKMNEEQKEFVTIGHIPENDAAILSGPIIVKNQYVNSSVSFRGTSLTKNLHGSLGWQARVKASLVSGYEDVMSVFEDEVSVLEEVKEAPISEIKTEKPKRAYKRKKTTSEEVSEVIDSIA